MKAYDLDPEDLRKAQQVIDRARPGRYILSELFGPGWKRIPSPTKFGRGFARAVGEKRLIGISIHPNKTSANATQYDVHQR